MGAQARSRDGDRDGGPWPGAGGPPPRRRAAPPDTCRPLRRSRDTRRGVHAFRDARRRACERAAARRRRQAGSGRRLRGSRERARRAGLGRRAGRRAGVERMNVSAGATLRVVRERKPLVHQITNYVVMNETANATLALGALPVMAHAREEVEEMVALAGALVLNIGTLSPHWVDAMLSAGKGANAHGTPVVLDPVGAGATSYRTETARRMLSEIDVTVVRGNQGEVATLVGVDAEVRGVESIGAADNAADVARLAGRALGVVASVTGPVDHVSDGDRLV